MHLNRYRRTFKALCPNNGIKIVYLLTISTTAGSLHAQSGGFQTLRAPHHGVQIVTVRDAGFSAHHYWQRAPKIRADAR